MESNLLIFDVAKLFARTEADYPMRPLRSATSVRMYVDYYAETSTHAPHAERNTPH